LGLVLQYLPFPELIFTGVTFTYNKNYSYKPYDIQMYNSFSAKWEISDKFGIILQCDFFFSEKSK